MRSTAKKIVAAYLRFLTHIVIWRHRPRIIAVTGITNKTTTQRAIIRCLKENGDYVRANPRSYNTEIGLPLAVLYAEIVDYKIISWILLILKCTFKSLFERRFPNILVLEFGVSDVGDISKLVKIILPEIVIYTNIQPSSINPNTSIQQLTDEMIVLAERLPSRGCLIYNGDDINLRTVFGVFHGTKISYGIINKADVQATNVIHDISGIKWSVNGVDMSIRQRGEHHIYAELAAVAVKKWLDQHTL